MPRSENSRRFTISFLLGLIVIAAMAVNANWLSGLGFFKPTIGLNGSDPANTAIFLTPTATPTFTPTSPSCGTPGSPDASFTTSGGKVITPVGSGADLAYSVSVQPDGKIIAAGYVDNPYRFALVRYNTDGSLDTSFGADGKVITTVGSNLSIATSVAVQADGKIIAAGYADDDFAVARYNADGSLDTSFDGDGKVTTPVESGADLAYSVAVQPDGRIIVGGIAFNGTNNDFALVRYNTDGSLDTSFDGDGKVMTSVGGTNAVNSVVVQPDGRIIAAGNATSNFTLVRYNADGSLDTSFDGDGKVMTAVGSYSTAYSVAVQPDGRIIAAGDTFNGTNYDFALVRYNTDGSLDTSFDGDGKLVTPVGSGNDTAYSVAVQADGRIIAAGQTYNGTKRNFALVRYNADGSLDTSFDGDGKAITPVVSGDDVAYSVAVQPDGKIIAAGVAETDTNTSGFALVRYNADGSLDASFNPSVITPVGSGDDFAYSVAIQPDGKIIAAGFVDNPSYSFALVRYNTDGSLDTSFDGDGKVITQAGSNLSVATSVAVQPDGRIIAAGYANGTSFDDDFALVRYNADGSLDTSFDGDGKVITPLGSSDDFAYSVAVQPDGRIIVAGFAGNGSNSDFALVRYNADGSLDTSFDGDGKVITPVGSYDGANSVAVQPDGRIIAAGYAYNGTDYDFALVRYNADGSLDTSFDGDGKLMTPVGSSADLAHSVAVQPDGRIITAGQTFNGTNYDFALVRYNTYGSLDTSFDGDGKVITPVGSGNDVAYSVALQPDGKMITAGVAHNSTKNDFALVRYNADGSLDTSFDGDGKVIKPIASGDDGAYSVALQPDGRIIAAGGAVNELNNSDFALVRYFGLTCGPTPTNTSTPTNTATPTVTSTETSTATNTPTPPAIVSGTVTYGNAIGNPPAPRFVRSVSVASTVGSPPVGPVITGTPGTYTLTGFGAGSYTIKPTKAGGPNGAISSNDAARVAQGVAGTSPFVTMNQKFAADASGNGSVTSADAAKIAQFVAGITPLPPPNVVGQWRFFTADLPGSPSGPLPTPPYNDSRSYASVSASASGEDYVAILVGEASGNYNPASHARPVLGPERSISVELPSMTAVTEKEITVPVRVHGAAAKEIISYEFDLRYDPSVIQPQAESADVVGTASRGLSVVINPSEPDLLRVVVYGAQPIDEDGVLLNLKFTAVGSPGSLSPLTFERIMFNEGEPQVTPSEGQVELF